MIYSYDGDNVESVLSVGRAMYDKFLNDSGNFHSGNTVLEDNYNVWNDDYIGIGKNEYYYYRDYGAKKNLSSGAVDDYALLFSAFRTAFNINDNVVRPFFAKSNTNFSCRLIVGVKENKGAWNFTNKNYGDVNNSIDRSLLDNTNYSSAILRFKLKFQTNADTIVNCLTNGKSKTDNYSISLDSKYNRYTLDMNHNGFAPAVLSYAYGFDTTTENIYSYTLDTNIPCFDEDNIEGIQNWIDNGDRGGEIAPLSPTKTDFKLWIKGVDAPTYKLNWHNNELENDNFDFSNSKIYVKVTDFLGNAFNVSFKEVDYTDGYVKFTWYDLESLASTNFVSPWLKLDIQAKYNNNGEVSESSYCSISLRKKADNFENMYKDVTSGSDGTNITVVNYDDDPGGFDSDEDDYHDPSDNEDSTVDDSEIISVSGEVCKTFIIEQIELRKLSQFLWSSSFLDNILMINNSPIENIISLKAIMGSAVSSGSSQTLTLGNVQSTVNVVPCQESITIDVGSITLPKKYNNFLDFEPYTKVQIYLPFYGCAMLDSSIVIGRTINIKYIIDVITATAKIKILHDDKTLYEFKTICGSDLPITSSNRASIEMGFLSSGLGMGVSLASGNILGGIASGLSIGQSQYHSSTSGSVSGVLNFHDSRMVTILVDRPVYTELLNFNKTHGRMCNLSKTLRNLSGFTKCAENVQIDFNCLEEERKMIVEQLASGVII